ncbi:xanthine dehydrogenase/oxidase-like isoform X2 [Salvelinus namaycush]|uniref:Xanthine dehydrogenase/oxidase-like isoform X2 n=1 Tax=Salvelinus namaycush TaxID=8040 RepID=A0A8U0QDD3_SALNM|nr:xanthine dehydrogenase/oxidase-like isoform X2 [Salvelinus namaycush]
MSMYALLRNHPTPRMADIEEAFQGNLCRCTGYRPILEGYKTFTKERKCCGGKGKDNGCCMTNGVKTKGNTDEENVNSLCKDQSSQQLRFRGERVLWLQPASLDQLLELKTQYPNAKMVVGNTEVGIEMKFKNLLYPVILAPAYIPELNTIQHTDEGIVFGASCSLTLLGDVLKAALVKLPSYQTEVFTAVLEQLRWFAGLQIRNVAAIGGNIMTASPISDLNPVFMAAGCKLTLMSKGGERVVVMDEKFFPGYRRTILTPEEVLLCVLIPYTKKGQYFAAYKQSPRREDDISIVTSGMSVTFAEGSTVVKHLALSYGGMAATTVMAKNTASRLLGKQWGEELLQDACSSLAEEMTLHPSAPGGMVTYRRTLTLSLFYKFYLTVQQKLASEVRNIIIIFIHNTLLLVSRTV